MPTTATKRRRKDRLRDAAQAENRRLNPGDGGIPSAVGEQPVRIQTAKVNPEDLPDDIQFSYDHAHAVSAGAKMDNLVRVLAAAKGIPADEYDRPATLLGLFTYAMLWFSAQDPSMIAGAPDWFLPRPDPDDDDVPDPDRWASYPPREVRMSAREAMSASLRLVKPPRDKDGERIPKPPATLPGCQGHDGKCNELRRVGERFCPRCRKAELRRMRESVTPSHL